MARSASGKTIDIYGGDDPRKIPAYPLSEVARYLGVPRSTLRSWTIGQNYRTKKGLRFFHPLIAIADKEKGVLSFMNFLEAHVLTALRRQHLIGLPTIREALERILKANPKSRHPLGEYQFATVGVNLFVEEATKLVNMTRHGQLGLAECLHDYLQRIERDPAGSPVRLYPFPGGKPPLPDWPRTVVMDPRIAFGRPVIVGTSVPTAEVAKRITAGETIEEIAEDYDRPAREILEAVRWELARAA